jgi:hypothetical protein
MAKVSETYAGTYLNASELLPLRKRRIGVVHGASVEAVGNDQDNKIVLELVSSKGEPWPKSVILNKTNAMQMAAAFGDDTDQWPGKTIEVWAENVMFQGKFVPGIRVQAASAAALPAMASAAASTAPNGMDDTTINDAIPF